MPVINFSYEDLIDLLGYGLDRDRFLEEFPMIGCDVERVEGDEIGIEIFPDRPDMNSVEGIARAVRSFFEIEPGLKEYRVRESDVTTYVDKSVENIRPFIATALIKGVDVNDRVISSIMDLQEKLHHGIGRNRKKMAIGVHDFDKVSQPFTYKAVDPSSTRFVPLGFTEEMSLEEILKRHPKGVEYGYLLKDKERYPLLIDSNNNVLSFPPIINGRLTEVNTSTRNIFIDVTGEDENVVRLALNIISTALAERGGEIHLTKVIYGDEVKIYPELSPVERRLKKGYAERIIGVRLAQEDVKRSLLRMGYDVRIEGDEIIVRIPAWRGDILHDIDVVEDIAIGYGFNRIEPDKPKCLTYGRSLKKSRMIKKMRTILIGLGFCEVATLTLSNKRDELERMGSEGKVIEIENPISGELSCVRASLLPSLMKICRANRHRPLPQRIFEVGYVVNEEAKNELHLSFLEIDEGTNFSRCKSLFEAISRDAGMELEMKRYEHPAFIKGRCAGIYYRGELIGYFGELHPKTLVEFDLEHPGIALEMNLDQIEGC